jgi:hypothetical protein
MKRVARYVLAHTNATAPGASAVAAPTNEPAAAEPAMLNRPFSGEGASL